MDAASPTSDLPIRELEARITELAGHLNAAGHRWLQLIAEFDRRQGWSDGFTRSCAHWLSWKCGLEMCAAREHVRVARALEALPAISAAMSRGELSYSKVRAVTRVATPATESVLLNVALHGTTQHIETLVRQFRRVQEVEELGREARQQANRRLTWLHDADGSLVIKVQLPAEAGAVVLKALEAALADVPFPGDCLDPLNDSAESSTTSNHGFREKLPLPSVRRADALVVLAESFLAHGAATLKPGDRQQIVVHVDEATLREREAGRCELDEGPAIAIETARRLACDASVVRIVENGQGEPLDVGRKTRSIPPALRRALAVRDQGCVFPGCGHTRYVDGHHIQHWAAGGETKLGNLVSLCRFHHRAVHEGGLRVERLDDGAWRFVRPNGKSIEACVPGRTRPMADWTRLVRHNVEQGVAVTPATATTRWRGERMDYGIAVDALLYRSRAAKGPGVGPT